MRFLRCMVSYQSQNSILKFDESGQLLYEVGQLLYEVDAMNH